MSSEDISENFEESYHCKNLKFENFCESQLKMLWRKVQKTHS